MEKNICHQLKWRKICFYWNGTHFSPFQLIGMFITALEMCPRDVPFSLTWAGWAPQLQDCETNRNHGIRRSGVEHYSRIRRLKLPAPRERMQPLQSFFNDECQCNKPIDFAAPAALGPLRQCIYKKLKREKQIHFLSLSLQFIAFVFLSSVFCISVLLACPPQTCYRRTRTRHFAFVT